MANIRVYDLAKQLGLENKALMKILADNGIEKKPTSSITEEEADIARKDCRFIKKRQLAFCRKKNAVYRQKCTPI